MLDSYEAERRPVAEQVIWAASSLHDIFMAHGKSIAAREKAMFEPGYTERVVNTCSGVAYTYRDYVEKVAGVDDMDGPAIGDRAPDVDFEGGGALWDYCRHPDYTLLTMRGGDADGARSQSPPRALRRGDAHSDDAEVSRVVRGLWAGGRPDVSDATRRLRRLQVPGQRSGPSGAVPGRRAGVVTARSLRGSGPDLPAADPTRSHLDMFAAWDTPGSRVPGILSEHLRTAGRIARRTKSWRCGRDRVV